jgi:hypothetical protein
VIWMCTVFRTFLRNVSWRSIHLICNLQWSCFTVLQWRKCEHCFFRINTSRLKYGCRAWSTRIFQLYHVKSGFQSVVLGVWKFLYPDGWRSRCETEVLTVAALYVGDIHFPMLKWYRHHTMLLELSKRSDRSLHLAGIEPSCLTYK